MRNRWEPPATPEHSAPGGAARRARPPSSGNGRWIARIAIVCLLWLGFLAGPSQQVGAFLADHGYAQAGDALRAAADWTIRTALNIPEHVSALADPHAQHRFWQVGLGAGREDIHVTGMRAEIQTVVPQQVADQTTNYFWVGSYLSDGSFVQVGYYVRWDDQRHAGWFYCSFDAAKRQGPCAYGDPGSAGADGSRHTYTLAASANGAGAFTWHADMDGTALGDFTLPVGETGTNAPGIFAESSGFDPHDPTSRLGPVDFRSGILVRHADAAGYTRAARELVQYNAANICPPYGVAPDGHGGALMGSDQPCPDHFAPLG